MTQQKKSALRRDLMAGQVALVNGAGSGMEQGNNAGCHTIVCVKNGSLIWRAVSTFRSNFEGLLFF